MRRLLRKTVPSAPLPLSEIYVLEIHRTGVFLDPPQYGRHMCMPPKHATFDDFYNLLEELHMMTEAKVPFRVSYVDPKDNDLLPINNTDNYLRALQGRYSVLSRVSRH